MIPPAFPYQWQQATNWCWAACACMASQTFRKPAIVQCDLVGKVRNISGCCTSRTPTQDSLLTADDLPAGADDALNSGDVGKAFAAAGVQAIQFPAPTEANVGQGLSQGALVLLMLQVQTEFHYMLVVGIAPRVPAVAHTYAIADPNPQIQLRADVSFEVLQSAYGQGGIVAGWRLTPGGP